MSRPASRLTARDYKRASRRSPLDLSRFRDLGLGLAVGVFLTSAVFIYKSDAHKAVEPDSPRYRTLDMHDSEPVVYVQQVAHPSRVHLDIETEDREADPKLEQQYQNLRYNLPRTYYFQSMLYPKGAA